MQPISKKRFLEILDFQPKVLEFDPKKSKLYGIKNWNLEVISNNSPTLSYNGEGNPIIIKEEVQEKLLNILKQNQNS